MSPAPSSPPFPYTTLFRSPSTSWRAPAPSRSVSARRRLRPSASRPSAPWTEGRDAEGRRRRRAETERSEEHTSELQSLRQLVCRLLLEKKKKKYQRQPERA